jgi:hypothetical protein
MFPCAYPFCSGSELLKQVLCFRMVRIETQGLLYSSDRIIIFGFVCVEQIKSFF